MRGHTWSTTAVAVAAAAFFPHSVHAEPVVFDIGYARELGVSDAATIAPEQSGYWWDGSSLNRTATDGSYTIFTPATRQYDAFARVSPSVRPADTCAPAAPVQFFSTTPARLTAGAVADGTLLNTVVSEMPFSPQPPYTGPAPSLATDGAQTAVVTGLLSMPTPSAAALADFPMNATRKDTANVVGASALRASSGDDTVVTLGVQALGTPAVPSVICDAESSNSSYAAAVDALNAKLRTDVFILVADTDYDKALSISTGQPLVVTEKIDETSASLALAVAPTLVGASQADAVVAAACVSARNVAVGPRLTNTSFHATADTSLTFAASPEEGSAARLEVRHAVVSLTLLSDATQAPVGAARTAWEGASGVCRIDSALVRGGNGGDSVTTVPVDDIGFGPLISGLFSYQVVPAFGIILERLTVILRHANETAGVDVLIPHITVVTGFFQTEPFHSAILRVPELRDRDATGTVGAKDSFLLTAAVRRSTQSPTGSEVLAFQREVRKPAVTIPGLGMGADAAKEFTRKAYEDGSSPVSPPETIAITRRYANATAGFVTAEFTASFVSTKLQLMQRLPLRSITKDTPLYPKVATGTPAPDTPLPQTPEPTPAPTPAPKSADAFTGVCPIEEVVGLTSAVLTLSFQIGDVGGKPAIQFTVEMSMLPADSYAAIGLRAPGILSMKQLDVYVVDNSGSGAISDRNVDGIQRPATDAENNAYVSLKAGGGSSVTFYRLITTADAANDFDLAPYVPPKGKARGDPFDIAWAVGRGTADSIAPHTSGSKARGIIKGISIAGCKEWYEGSTPAEPDFVGAVTAFEALDADVTGYDGEAADALDVTPGAAEYRRLVFLLADAAASPRVLALSLFYNLAAASDAAIAELPVAPIRLSHVLNFTFFPAAFQTPPPAGAGGDSFFDDAFNSSSALNAYAVGLHVLPEAAACGGGGEAGLRGSGNASIALVRPFYAVSQWGLTRKLVLGTGVPDGYYELASTTPAPTDVPPTQAPSMGDTVSPEMNANDTDIPENEGNTTTPAPDTPTPPERGAGVGGVFILPEWEGVATYGGYQAGYNGTAVKAVGSDLYLFNHRDVLEDMSDQAGVPFTRYKGLRVAAAGYTRDEQRGLLEAGARATAAVGSGGMRHTAPVYVYVNVGSAPLNSYKGPAAGSIAAPRRNIVTAQDVFVVSPVLDMDKLIFDARQKLKKAVNGTTPSSTRRMWFVSELPCKDAGPDGGDIFDPDMCQDAALSAGCIPVGDLLLKASLALRDDAQRDVKAVFATAEAYYVPDMPLSGTRSVVGRGMWIDGFCADIVPHNVTAADIEAVAAEDATKGVLQPLAFGLRGATTGPGLLASLSRYALGPPLDPGTVASTMLNYKYDSDLVASFANSAKDWDYLIILWDRACQKGAGDTSAYLSDGAVLNTTLGQPATPTLEWLYSKYPTLLVPRGRNVTYSLFPPRTAGSTVFPKRFQSALVVRGVAAADRFARSVTEPTLELKALFSLSQGDGVVACRRLAVGNECDLEPCGTKAHCYDPDEAKQGDYTCTCAVSYEGEKSVGTKPVCVEPSKGVKLLTLIIIVVAGFCALVLVCGAFFGYRSRRSVNNLERNLRDSAEALTTQRSGFDQSRFTGWQEDVGRCETSIKQLERDSAGSRGMSSELKEVSRLYEAEYASEPLASSDLHQRLAAVDSMSRDLSNQHASLGRGLDVLL